MADNKAQKEKQKLKYPQNMKGKQKKMHFKHQTKKDEAKERWKKKVLYDFKKQQRRQRPAAGGVDVQKLYAEMSSSEDEQQSADPSPLPSSAAPRERFQKKKEASRFSRAQRDYQQKAEKKQQKYEEVVKKKHEQEAALQSYREKKKAKFLRMCKKTPRGQPIMKYRIHHLLEQIDQQTKGTRQTQGTRH